MSQRQASNLQRDSSHICLQNKAVTNSGHVGLKKQDTLLYWHGAKIGFEPINLFAVCIFKNHVREKSNLLELINRFGDDLQSHLRANI